ncbi:MAG: hypothetical protein A4E68_01919 [Syntrophaceae bacterium PtaB.Bin095]|jgi:hypothetical protein|nr:MAG: hypothetical protein A4E68_01919 [Syntrophaceae bacterium PtaB.Bin095]
MSEGLITWESVKKKGSEHYKSAGGVEPIDLYRSLGILDSFALGSIIKYASRMARAGVNRKDCEKIRHYADILTAGIKG